jgi:hypothetical protein
MNSLTKHEIAENQQNAFCGKIPRNKKMHFFIKKTAKTVGSLEKSSTFAVAIEQALTP